MGVWISGYSVCKSVYEYVSGIYFCVGGESMHSIRLARSGKYSLFTVAVHYTEDVIKWLPRYGVLRSQSMSSQSIHS